MKVDIKFNISDFPIPDFVQEVQAAPRAPLPAAVNPEPYPGDRRFKLSELSPEALATLCNKFTVEVFKRAGKTRPTTALPASHEKEYQALISAVACKFPNESRFNTALRYIKERETCEATAQEVDNREV